MEAANYGIILIQHDISNAKRRNTNRIKRQDIQSQAIQSHLMLVASAIKLVRYKMKQIDKLEKRERETKKKRKRQGRNRLGGTYGK